MYLACQLFEVCVCNEKVEIKRRLAFNGKTTAFHTDMHWAAAAAAAGSSLKIRTSPFPKIKLFISIRTSVPPILILHLVCGD